MFIGRETGACIITAYTAYHLTAMFNLKSWQSHVNGCHWRNCMYQQICTMGSNIKHYRGGCLINKCVTDAAMWRKSKNSFEGQDNIFIALEKLLKLEYLRNKRMWTNIFAIYYLYHFHVQFIFINFDKVGTEENALTLYLYSILYLIHINTFN